MSEPAYDRNVFLNCPFDEEYQPLFRAMVFTVEDCGFRARCALEAENSGEVRIDKINRIIRECRHGIHDISRTEPDPVNSLPRFNMPLELGLFRGAREFGSRVQQQKNCLIGPGAVPIPEVLLGHRGTGHPVARRVSGAGHPGRSQLAVRVPEPHHPAARAEHDAGAIRDVPGGPPGLVHALAPGPGRPAVRGVPDADPGVGDRESAGVLLNKR